MTIRCDSCLKSPMSQTKDDVPAIGIIGGSGLYQMDELRDIRNTRSTRRSAPSDVIVGGKVAGGRFIFCPAHARGHRILPHELNHRANIWALRSLDVRWIICVTAVGSCRSNTRREMWCSIAVLRSHQPADRAHLLSAKASRRMWASPSRSAPPAQSGRGIGADRWETPFTTAALT